MVAFLTRRGPAGPEGPAGPPGPQGDQGPLGPEGKAGPQGEPGPQGSQGVQGPEGPQGPQGPDGKGEVGAEGPQGPAGPQGEVGPQGEEGPEGLQGPQGPEGKQGPKGDAGAQGVQGPKGDAGAQGIQGIQGAEGPQGPKGEKGEAGAKGEKGERGDKGDTGTSFDPYDSLPYIVPNGIYPGTTQGPIAKRAYLNRFTVARKREFKFVRLPVGVVGTGEDKVDVAIYKLNGSKLERLSSNGGVKVSFTVLGVKVLELGEKVVCEPGVVYYVASSQETVTGTPQWLACLNNNGSVGDMAGSGTLGNRIMLIRNETFPLPSVIETVTSSSPTTYMVPSEV